MWGMLEFALFAASASSIAALFYMVTPYVQQIRESHSIAFMTQLKESKQIFAREPTFYAFILLSCLSYPILTYLGKLVPIWFSQQGISGDWYAGFNISFGLGSLLTGLIVTKILRQFSHTNIIVVSMSVLAFALIGMSLSASPVTILMFTALFGTFNALNRIARINWMHHSVSVHQRGRVDGGISMFATTVQSLSYVLIAMLSHYGLTQYGFTLAAATVLLAVFFMWHFQGKLNQQDNIYGYRVRDCNEVN
jgi:predicted MFS family arabinose efflux permease